MPDVTVTVPGLLARFTDGGRTVALRADTLEGCLDRLLVTYPAIEPHLVDGMGRLRPHLRLVHNGRSVEPSDDRAIELAPGDEVVVIQAISGG